MKPTLIKRPSNKNSNLGQFTPKIDTKTDCENNQNAFNDQCCIDTCYNITLGKLYGLERLSCSYISDLINSINNTVAYENELLSVIIQFIYLPFNNFIFQTCAQIMLCAKNSFRSCDASSFYDSLLYYINGYVESICLLIPSCEAINMSNYFSIINWFFLLFNSIISLFDYIIRLINGICDSPQKFSFLSCIFTYISKILQPYLSIFFPCGITKPCTFNCSNSTPVNNCSNMSANNIPNISANNTKKGTFDIPNCSNMNQSTILNILSQIFLKGDYSSIFSMQDTSFTFSKIFQNPETIIITVLTLLLSSFSNEKTRKYIQQILSKHPLTQKMCDLFSEAYQTPQKLYNLIKEQFVAINLSSLIQGLYTVCTNVLYDLKSVPDIKTLTIVVGICLLPLLFSNFTCCYNSFWFVYLTLRFIIDNIYLLQCMVESFLYGDFCFCDSEKDNLAKSFYNLYSYLLLNIESLLIPFIFSLLTCTPRLPRYFIKDLHKLYMPLLNSYRDQCNPCNIVITNLISELNCMLEKLYKSCCSPCNTSEAINQEPAQFDWNYQTFNNLHSF